MIWAENLNLFAKQLLLTKRACVELPISTIPRRPQPRDTSKSSPQYNPYCGFGPSSTRPKSTIRISTVFDLQPRRGTVFDPVLVVLRIANAEFGTYSMRGDFRVLLGHVPTQLVPTFCHIHPNRISIYAPLPVNALVRRLRCCGVPRMPGREL